MVKERKVFLTDIGEVRIKKRKGSRRISIRINPEGHVSMTVPYFTAYSEAEKFLLSKMGWVKQKLIELNEKKAPRIVYSEENLPRTKFHEIIISRNSTEKLRRKFSQSLCEIFIPAEADIKRKEIQDYIKSAIVEIYRREAKIILVNRCRALAAEHGFRIKEVKVKKMKSRWGSCSSKGNINLNIFLMAIPDELSDYVILHELVHTRVLNHSGAFWSELQQILPDARSLSKKMRKYSNLLISLDS